MVRLTAGLRIDTPSRERELPWWIDSTWVEAIRKYKMINDR